MIRLSAFEIHQPASVAEASDALRDFGDDASLYAGGTELLLAMKTAGLRYRHLVDVKTIPGLRGVQALPDGRLRIGSATTHRELERSSDVQAVCPVLAETASRVANPRVRASGTLGGNLCFAEPHSDLATLLLCLGATCHIADAEDERTVPLDELIVGPYETSLAPGDVLVSVDVPAQPADRRSTYAKFQVHERPMLGLALALDLAGGAVADARVAVGCISFVPRRSPRAEELLRGPVADARRRLDEAAAALAEDAEPIDDQDGSAEYKTHLVGVFLRRQFERAVGNGHSAPVGAGR